MCFWFCITDYGDDTPCCHMIDDLSCALDLFVALHNYVQDTCNLQGFVLVVPVLCWNISRLLEYVGLHVCLLPSDYEGWVCLSLYYERLCWTICSTMFCNIFFRVQEEFSWWQPHIVTTVFVVVSLFLKFTAQLSGTCSIWRWFTLPLTYHA